MGTQLIVSNMFPTFLSPLVDGVRMEVLGEVGTDADDDRLLFLTHIPAHASIHVA